MTNVNLYVSGEISNRLRDIIIAECAGANNIWMYLDSLGGNVSAGISIHDFIKSSTATTTVCGMGNIFSAAVLVFLSFTNRFSTPSSSWMVHPTTISNNLPMNANEMDIARSLTVNDDERIVNTIHSDLPLTTIAGIRASLNSHRTFLPVEAQQIGIIQAIVNPILPISNVIYITDSVVKKF